MNEETPLCPFRRVRTGNNLIIENDNRSNRKLSFLHAFRRDFEGFAHKISR